MQKRRTLSEKLFSPSLRKPGVHVPEGKWVLGQNWSVEVLTMALTLNNISVKAYKFLRNTKVLPLPGFSTIVRHFKNFTVSLGYLVCVTILLKVKAASMTKKESQAGD